MAKLYVAYPVAPENKQENGRNAALVVAADSTAALAALKLGKLDGSTNDSKLDRWAFSEIADPAGALPHGGAVLWLDGLSNFGAHRAF
jgi:hypothetical protein